MSAEMDVLVIEPGHGSTWLSDAVFVDRKGKPNPRGRFVYGKAWEYDGGWNMPDDYRGMEVGMTYPRRLILKVEFSAARTADDRLRERQNLLLHAFRQIIHYAKIAPDSDLIVAAAVLNELDKLEAALGSLPVPDRPAEPVGLDVEWLRKALEALWRLMARDGSFDMDEGARAVAAEYARLATEAPDGR